MPQESAKTNDKMTGLMLEPSADCNLQCVFCFRRSFSHPPQAPRFMSLEVAEAVAPYLQGLESIDLSGWGEPLLNPRFFELVQRLRRSFSGRLTMTTNGLLLTASAMKRLIRMEFDIICISIDAANERAYHRVRPGGDFNRLRKNLEEFSSLVALSGKKKPMLFGTFLLRRDALAQVPDFAAMVAGHGLQGAVFQQMTGVCSEAALSQVTHSGYYGNDFDESALEAVMKKARESAPAGFMVLGPEKILDRRVGDCGGYDISRPFITASGEVSLCCAAAYPCALVRRDGKLEKTRGVSFGNVLKKPLPEIWQSPAYAKARAEVRGGEIPEICGDCIGLYMEKPF